jgi:hypothetical protein
MPVGRNDPCSCGSGKKYKKCCGAVIPLATAPVRQCGTCTACCDGWVIGTIEGHEMRPGTPCYFRGEGCCTIYERRPQKPCRDFICGWMQRNNPFPDDWRPNQLGVMVIPMKWRGRDAYILRHAGRDPDERMLAWMRDLSQRTGRPFFYEIAGERYGFGPPEFQSEMADRVARGEALW